MAAGFRIRSVRGDRSLGDLLRSTRARKKIALTDVEEATKIRGRYVQALENDAWEQLPSLVYAKGYLDQYARFLGIADEVVAERYEMARATYEARCGRSPIGPRKALSLSYAQITPRLVGISTVCGAFILLASVVGTQLMQFTAQPSLEIISPSVTPGLEVKTAEKSLMIKGHVEQTDELTVNGAVVSLQGDGTFQAEVPATTAGSLVSIVARRGERKVDQVFVVRLHDKAATASTAL
jgi:cytoskeletal protein RodZ